MAQNTERLAIKVQLPPFRMSFPHLFKPQDTDGGPKYQLNMLFPPKTDFRKFEDALYDCMEDLFGKDPKKWPKGRNDRGPDEVIRDATEKDYEGYNEGWKFVKAASKNPVGIVDARRDPVLNEREVYGGRWARASVTVIAYDNKSKGVGVYLNSIQLLDHDEQFGGRGPAKDDFEDWDGDPLSNDDRGTSTSAAGGRSRGEDREDDRDRGRGPRDTGRDDGRGSRGRSDRGDDEPRGRDSRRSREEDEPRGRGRDRDDDRGGRDTRDRDRDDRADDRGSRRSREPEDDRGSRRGDDDRRGSRDRDDRDRDDDRRGRGARDEDERPSRSTRDRDDRDDRDERPSRSRRDRDEEWT